MAKATKRPSKAAKAAKRIVESSKLLVNKTERDTTRNSEPVSTETTPRTSTAIKPRPDKKRG